MDIEKMLNSLTPSQLEAGLSKLSGVLSETQVKQIKSVLQNSNKDELAKKLKDVDINQVKNSPDFKNLF